MHRFQIAFSTALTAAILFSLSFMTGKELSIEYFGGAAIASILFHSCLEIYLAVKK